MPVSKDRAFANGAKIYMECALAADDTIGTMPGFEVQAPYPVMSNVAHSIELALKSYLHSNGYMGIRSLGNDLVKAVDACKRLADDNSGHLNPIDTDLLVILSDIRQNLALRYGEPSSLGRLPVFGPMQEIANQCLKMYDAPSRSDLWGSV